MAGIICKQCDELRDVCLAGIEGSGGALARGMLIRRPLVRKVLARERIAG